MREEQYVNTKWLCVCSKNTHKIIKYIERNREWDGERKIKKKRWI